jgi:hypothetical protein
MLDSAGRETFPSHPIEDGIFGTGFVISPGKGVWQITGKGRNYVRSNPSGGRSTETGQPLQQAEPPTSWKPFWKPFAKRSGPKTISDGHPERQRETPLRPGFSQRT